MKKNPTTLRFTDVSEELLLALVEKLGVTKTAVIEMAVRKFAEREGVQVSQSNPR